MKKVTAVLALVLMTVTLFAASVRIEWCPNPEGDVAGYKVYYVETNKVANWKPNIYNGVTNCPPILLTNGVNWVRNYNRIFTSTGLVTTATISNLTLGKTYYFAVTAYDGGGLESDFSAEIEVSITNVAPGQPQNFKVLDVR